MRTRLLLLLFASVLLVITIVVGVRGAGPAPPLGQFLDPVRGAWAAVTYAALPVTATVPIPGLSAPVQIRYDVRGVPHIFAQDEEDVMRALGYVVARDR